MRECVCAHVFVRMCVCACVCARFSLAIPAALPLVLFLALEGSLCVCVCEVGVGMWQHLHPAPHHHTHSPPRSVSLTFAPHLREAKRVWPSTGTYREMRGIPSKCQKSPNYSPHSISAANEYGCSSFPGCFLWWFLHCCTNALQKTSIVLNSMTVQSSSSQQTSKVLLFEHVVHYSCKRMVKPPS